MRGQAEKRRAWSYTADRQRMGYDVVSAITFRLPGRLLNHAHFVNHRPRLKIGRLEKKGDLTGKSQLIRGKRTYPAAAQAATRPADNGGLDAGGLHPCAALHLALASFSFRSNFRIGCSGTLASPIRIMTVSFP
jgi:hypothetical protein